MPRTALAPLFLLALIPCLGALPEPPAQVPVQPPAVRMTHLTIGVEVVDGLASTRLKQVWRNDGASQAEATWLLPLPPGAVADGFTLTVNGVPIPGEVLGADAARAVYEGIVRRRRDPGLLEYFGNGCLRARIWPIPVHGETSVEVGFRSVLPELLGLRRWSFALQAAGAEGLAPGTVVLDLTIRSRRPIKNAFSPLAGLQVVQKDDHEVRASYEGSAAALGDGELAVFYGLSEAEFGLDLLTHRRAQDPEGTFLMLVSPKREWQSQETMKKSIVFVLDTSGSMEGAKIEQAKNALRFFLQSLAPEDRFDVVPFATEPEPFFGERVPASGERIAEALARVGGLTAAGGTNIDGALAAALAGPGELAGRVPIVVFLTDGEPTVGETGPDAILAAVKASNAARARVFVFGVGAQVNTYLLDTLAGQNGGARDYVRENERIDEKTRALFAKLAHPVMTDLALTVDGLTPTKLVPSTLPDLFAGDRLELFGRYTGEGAHAIRLSGVVAGVRREYVYEATFARETPDELAFLAPLWAERRVGQLLDAIRLNGSNPELVAEIERLGRTYGIVTPYTSHLVVEPGLRVSGTGVYRGPSDSTPPGKTAGVGGGGSAGPATPGSGGPAAPGAPEREHAADSFFLGHAAKSAEDAFLKRLRELSRLGVLPAAESSEELRVLAARVVQELRESESNLAALGYGGAPSSPVGRKAVEDSEYLRRLMSGRNGGDSHSIFELFTRRVKDRTFVLRGGTWVEASLGETPPTERRRIEAFSAEYFALLTTRPELAPYLAFSPRLLLRSGAEVIEVFEPAVPPEPAVR